MKLLIVDDQSTIAKSLKDNLEGKVDGIDEIYTANSVREAKLIMMSCPINILLTDIEMPEENGLSLFRWTMEKYPGMVGVFLTSHAEFSYAREAIRLGGFDYILQPARLEEIQQVLLGAVKEAHRKKRFLRMEETGARIRDQRDIVMELFLINAREGNHSECEKLYQKLNSLFSSEYENSVFHTALIKIVRFEKKNNSWDSELVKLVFKNVSEELFSDYRAAAVAAREDLIHYYLAIATEENAMSQAQWEKGIRAFADFINTHMDFRIAVFPNRFVTMEYDVRQHKRREEKQPGVYWDEETASNKAQTAEDDTAARVRKAQNYIRENLSRSVSRTEVAQYLHINEDYLSRSFKKYTGYTFKDYDILVRMETAKTLLEQTKLPVSMVAQKVGFDNFSHFSQAFRKYSGKTPSEYR